MAVTLIFGLLLSPFLVLFFVPALIGIGADISARFGSGAERRTSSATEAAG